MTEIGEKLVNKLRKNFPEETKITDLIASKMYNLFKSLPYRAYVVDLYHDPIVFRDFFEVAFDSLLTFALKQQLPLLKKIVLPILHGHLIDGSPIFYHTNQLFRIEKGGEISYYIKCGSEIRKIDIEKWEVIDDKLTNLIKGTVVLTRPWEEYYTLYTTGKTMKIYGFKTVVDPQRGFFKQLYSRLPKLEPQISYVVFLPDNPTILKHIKEWLIGLPLGEASVILEVEFKPINISKEDLFFAKISREVFSHWKIKGKDTELYVLTRVVPAKVIPQDIVIYPITSRQQHFILYRKSSRKYLCYEPGTIVCKKINIVQR